MPLAPKSEWDWLLQSTLRLKPGVGIRFDTRGGYCLHDMRDGRSFGLDPWQIHLLRGVESGLRFSDIVRDVIGHFSAIAGRQVIVSIVRGLEQHDLLEVQAPRRPVTEPLPPKRRRFHRGWLDRLFPDLSRFWLAEAITFVLVITGVWTCHFSSAKSTAIPFEQKPFAAVEGDSPLASGADNGVPVRVWCRGIITSVLVREGDQVRAGDVLARIADPMAQATCDDLRQQLGESRMMRDQYYGAGDLVAYLRESKSMAHLAATLGEWEAKSSTVALRAPVDGRIRHKFFSEVVGNPVQPGDVLMTIEAADVTTSDELVAAMP